MRPPVSGHESLPSGAHLAQSSEPILIPKLRISFADFPYLHLSIRPEAVHLGDLLRISVRPSTRFIFTPSDFQGPAQALRTPRSRGAFRQTTSLSPVNPIPGTRLLTKKRQLFPGLEPTSLSLFALPLLLVRENQLNPCLGSGNINPIPFRLTGGFFMETPTQLAFASGLGPTNPWSTAVNMEPFSSLVLKGLT